MKWFLIIGLIAAVFLLNQKETNKTVGGNIQPNAEFAQILKTGLINESGEQAQIDSSKKYLVLYHSASW